MAIVFADDIRAWKTLPSKYVEPSFSSFAIYPISCKFYHHSSFTQTLTLGPTSSMEHTLLSGMIFLLGPSLTITTFPICSASVYSVQEHPAIFYHHIIGRLLPSNSLPRKKHHSKIDSCISKLRKTLYRENRQKIALLLA